MSNGGRTTLLEHVLITLMVPRRWTLEPCYSNVSFFLTFHLPDFLFLFLFFKNYFFFFKIMPSVRRNHDWIFLARFAFQVQFCSGWAADQFRSGGSDAASLGDKQTTQVVSCGDNVGPKQLKQRPKGKISQNSPRRIGPTLVASSGDSAENSQGS